MSLYGKLVCLNGPNSGKEYDLDQDLIPIGRSSKSAIVLDDQFASRNHAEIRRFENAYKVFDLHSKNGVHVDGQTLAPGASEWLTDGSELRLASTVFRFYDPSVTMTAPSLVAVRESGLRVEPSTRQVYVDGQLLEPPLSAKQFDLLWYLYENRGRAVSKDEIALAVWPEADGDIYDSNIDRMISRVRGRIEPANSDDTRFLTTVRGFGYRLYTD